MKDKVSIRFKITYGIVSIMRNITTVLAITAHKYGLRELSYILYVAEGKCFEKNLKLIEKEADRYGKEE